MTGRDLSPGIAAAATATPRARPELNQDAVALLDTPGARAVILADGIGSLADAGAAAQFVARTAGNLLEDRLTRGAALDFDALFLATQAALRERVAGEAGDGASWGTTLLMAVETPERYEIAYCGNGCVFCLRRGDLLAFDDATPLPWCYVNLLAPHTLPEQGREALYRYITPDAPRRCRPSVLSLGKEEDGLLLLGTDGIYSYDQVERGIDPSGTVWIAAEDTLVALHAHLRAACAAGSDDALAWNRLPERFLERRRSQQRLTDDASLGLLIGLPPPAAGEGPWS